MNDADHNAARDRDDREEARSPRREAAPDGLGEGPLKPGTDRYPGDSEGYRHAELGADPGTADSAGYRADSGRCLDSQASPHAQQPADPPRRAEPFAGQGPPARRRSRMDPRSGRLREIDFVGDGVPPPVEPRERQVNVRLDPNRYRDLCEAADLYGVAPTTMARMLVRRGTKAVLDERRRDDYLHEGLD
jgi:hypothetical protein